MKTLITVCALTVATAVAGCDGVEPCTRTNGGVERCGDGRDNDCDGQTDEQCSDCTPTNGGVEACGDSVDNDCDGGVDEGCGSGICRDGETRGCGATPQAGGCVERCVAATWGICISTSGGAEICGNEIDDDCDDSIDELCECATGDSRECGGSAGTDLCEETCDDGRWSECGPRPPNDGEEICDGLDNDCDGAIDNGGCACDVGDEQWCGGSPELHQCRQTCPAGTWEPCGPVGGGDVEETCGDGQDNDCDGEVDEPVPCSGACGDGVARCEGETPGECRNESWACSPDEVETELCPGDDTGICYPGERTRSCRSNCSWDTWGDCTGAVAPDPWGESCNGLDDDCNGAIDDGVTSSDDYGWNDTCEGAYWLATDPAVYVYGVLSETSDWFSFTAVDNWGFMPELVILEIVPPADIDVRITLYTGTCDGLVELANADVGFSGDAERIEWTETMCPTECEDGGEYLVEVYAFGSPAGCYELLVNGLN